MTELMYGDVVQISPNRDDEWSGCFLMVEEVSKNGVYGFIPAPQSNRVPLFKQWHEIDHVGHCIWQPIRLYEED